MLIDPKEEEKKIGKIGKGREKGAKKKSSDWSVFYKVQTTSSSFDFSYGRYVKTIKQNRADRLNFQAT